MALYLSIIGVLKNKIKLKFKIMEKTKNLFEEIVEILDYFNESLAKDVYMYPKEGKVIYNEEEKQYSVIIQAAGFNKEDIIIDAKPDEISFKGEIKDEKIKDHISRNKFNYILRRKDIDIESINANLENGILTVKFKTQAEKNSKNIKIN